VLALSLDLVSRKKKFRPNVYCGLYTFIDACEQQVFTYEANLARPHQLTLWCGRR
jgi:hypothetical protein